MRKKPKVHSHTNLEDDPIFPRYVTTYTLAAPDMSIQDRRATMDAAFPYAGQDILSNHLDDLERSTRDYLTQRNIPTDRIGLGTAKLTDKQDILARGILTYIAALREMLNKGDAKGSAIFAIYLTQARMEFNIRPHSDNVRSGKKIRAKAAKAREAKSNKRDKDKSKSIELFREMKTKNKHLTPNSAAPEIAKKVGKSKRAIQRYLEKLEG